MPKRNSNINQGYLNEGFDEISLGLSGSEIITSVVQPPIQELPPINSELKSEKITLKPRIGIITSMSFIVGTIIGSGIFISPTGVLKNSGSVGLCLTVWAISGILGLFGALCYLELSLAVPKSGAEYSYMLEAFGPLHPILGPLPAFLIVWSEVVVLRPASNVVKVLTFIEYFMRAFFPTCTPPNLSKKLLAIPIICFFSFVNSISVKMASALQNILSSIKLIGLLIILVAGMVHLGYGATETLELGFQNTEPNAFKISKAFYSAFWAYSGWNALSAVTEEMIQPKKDFTRAIWGSMIIVIIIYIGVNVSYFTAMTPEEMLESPAVAVTFSERVLGSFSYAVPFIVAASVLGSFNGSVFTIARISAVASRDGNFPEILSCIHVDKRTPIISIILNTIISLIMLSGGSISDLINFSNFILWIFSCFTMVSLLLLRRRKDLPKSYTAPTIFPIIFLLLSLYLVIAPIIDAAELKYLYAIIIIGVGVIVYVIFKVYKVRFKFTEKIERILKIIFICLPMEYEDVSKRNLNNNNLTKKT